MKKHIQNLFITLALSVGLHQASAQNPIITSFSQNGVLVCSGLQTGTVASVEWAASLAGPWQTNWASLTAVAVATNGTIQASVPMFYRVRGVAATNAIPTNTADGMALIPAGTFIMGNSIGDSDITDANPTNVTLSAFYMDTNLVTLSQWRTVYTYATNHSYGLAVGAGRGTNYPVTSINSYDSAAWCNARSQAAGLTAVYYSDAGLTQVYTNSASTTVFVNWTGNGYRLPTEAEWEKAARGGLSGQRYPWGNAAITPSMANYNTVNTSPVGSYPPNGYGLYDMAGNVFEWCWDFYAAPPYPAGSPYLGGTDPRGPSPTTSRVVRGGYYSSGSDLYLRCAARVGTGPAVRAASDGFRCIRIP